MRLRLPMLLLLLLCCMMVSGGAEDDLSVKPDRSDDAGETLGNSPLDPDLVKAKELLEGAIAEGDEAPPEPAPLNVDDLIQEGRWLLKKFKISEAVAITQRAVDLAPSYWRGLFHLGIAKEEQYGLNHANYTPLSEAVSAYSRAWNAEPRHYESVLNRGIALAKLGHADEAIESWERAVKVYPQDSRAPFNLGFGMQKLEPPEVRDSQHSLFHLTLTGCACLLCACCPFISCCLLLCHLCSTRRRSLTFRRHSALLFVTIFTKASSVTKQRKVGYTGY